MDLRGKRIYTGSMRLVDGWEVRPFAIQGPEGLFAPCLSTRRHAPGSEERQYLFEGACQSKEEAFALALARRPGLPAGD